MSRPRRGGTDLLTRPGRHTTRRDTVAGWLAPLLTAMMVLGAVLAGGLLLARGGRTTRPPAPVVVKPSSLLLLELRTADGTLLAVVGAGGTRHPAALTIPPTVLITIPGQGDGSTGDAADLPGSDAATAISNLLGAWIPHYAVFDPTHLGLVVDRAGGIQLFGSPKSGADIASAVATRGPARQLTWRETLGALFAADAAWTSADLIGSDDVALAAQLLTQAAGATMDTLPSLKVTAGFLRPDYEAIASMVGERFGLSGQVPIRVMVLNGTGAPGVGGAVARNLIPGGFRLVVSGNAMRFNHKVTLMVATSADSMAAAQHVRKLLGVGRVSVSGVPSGLADVTILVGEDYTKG